MTPWTAACQDTLSLTISWSCPSSRPLHWWCHPAISSSDTLFFCPQSFPASGTFPESQLFTSDDQILEFQLQHRSTSKYPGLISLKIDCLISLLSNGLSRAFSSTTVRRHQFFGTAFFMVQLSQLYVTTGKTIALTMWAFVSKVWSYMILGKCLTFEAFHSSKLGGLEWINDI